MGQTILVAGVGALGSQIAWGLARPDLYFKLIDNDHVELDANVLSGTTAFRKEHVGASKAVVMAEIVWRKGQSESSVIPFRLTSHAEVMNQIRNVDLVVDCFDNSVSRALLHGLPVPTVHVGVAQAQIGAVTWDERYTPPVDGPNDGPPPCTHQLGRHVLMFTSTLAVMVIDQFLSSGIKRDLVASATDFRVFA